MPKYHWLPFFDDDISGSRFCSLFFVEGEAAISVASTIVPPRTNSPFAAERAGLLHQMMMWSISLFFTAVLLIAAGLYQLTPLKLACLQHCRSPAQYLAEHFQPGAQGALRLRWKHGLYCLGCCWFLMALLFAGGIMNLIWIAGLSIYVLIEKIAPQGRKISRVAGVAMVLVGLWVPVWRYIA